jgi:hypothetical protein
MDVRGHSPAGGPAVKKPGRWHAAAAPQATHRKGTEMRELLSLATALALCASNG